MYVSNTRLNDEVGTHRLIAFKYLGLAKTSDHDCPGAGNVKTNWETPTEI
jgi:hypothetical protein